MTKGNGKDKAQQAAAQQPQQEEGQAEPVRMPVLGLILANPETGGLMLQINQQAVTEPLDFFIAVAQLGMGNAASERAKQRAGQILVPSRKIVRPPGL